MVAIVRPSRRPITLPKLPIPRTMHYRQSVQNEYVDISPYEVSIFSVNLRYYLDNPDELLRVLKDAPQLMEQLGNGTSPWHKMSWLPRTIPNIHIWTGHWKPMSTAPWECKDDRDDNYLTISANSMAAPYDELGVRHYISMEKHEQIVSEVKADIRGMFRSELESGIKTIAKHIDNTVQDLRQVQGEKERLIQERERIQREIERMEQLESKLEAKQRLEDERRALKEQQRAQKQSRSRAGYVYLLSAVHDPTLFKIGRTSNPDDRVKTFNVKLPFPVEYVCLIQTDDMYALESELHQRYADKRVNGEFFALDEHDVTHIRQLAGGNE
jgi:hypothetical protein